MSSDYVCQILRPYAAYVLKKIHHVKVGSFDTVSKFALFSSVRFERWKVK